MSESNGCRTIILLAPALFFLFPVAALISILERISKSLLYDHLLRSFRTGEFQLLLSRPGGGPAIEITLGINSIPVLVILGICMLAYTVTIISAAGIWQLKKVEGTVAHERTWVWVVLLSNIIMMGASLAGFGYATSVQASDGTWRSYEDAGVLGQELTRETWACQIHKIFPSEDWAGSTCATDQAMRYLLLPMAVAALTVLGSLWVLVRRRGGLTWVFGGQGRYAGFRGAYELQPQGQAVPYAGAPTGQWTQQPGQQWVSQPYSPWGPQPIAQVPKSVAHVEQRPVFQ
jgi:hypothetical protein